MTLKNSTRDKVFEQAGHECLFCGMTGEEHEKEYDRDLDVHHVIPKRKGGSNEPSNLIPVCISCHRTLESTQGEALARIAEDEMDSRKMAELERENERLQEEISKYKKQLDKKEETIMDMLTGVDMLLESSLSAEYYVVHASEGLHDSELIYSGHRFPRASEEFDNSDKNPTMEQKYLQIAIEDIISTGNIKLIEKESNVLADSILEYLKTKGKEPADWENE